MSNVHTTYTLWGVFQPFLARRYQDCRRIEHQCMVGGCGHSPGLATAPIGPEGRFHSPGATTCG
jgi:hypothetical protein